MPLWRPPMSLWWMWHQALLKKTKNLLLQGTWVLPRCGGGSASPGGLLRTPSDWEILLQNLYLPSSASAYCVFEWFKNILVRKPLLLQQWKTLNGFNSKYCMKIYQSLASTLNNSNLNFRTEFLVQFNTRKLLIAEQFYLRKKQRNPPIVAVHSNNLKHSVK